MPRPTQTQVEKLRTRLATIALMHDLARRVGAENPNQFACWFDKLHEELPVQTHSSDSGRWWKNFTGKTAIRDDQIDRLSGLPQFRDARQFYEHGPAGLWRAMWGDTDELWQLCGHQIHPRQYRESDGTSRMTDAFTFSGPELRFDESLYNFECSMLLGQQYGQMLELRDLAEAIAFYRLHRAINRLAQVDGVGAYRCVRMCLDDIGVSQELVALGIYGMLADELTSIEVARLNSEPSYRSAVGIDDIHGYATNPRAFCSIERRMEMLRID